MAALLDAHAKPPEAIRQVYKHFQKLDPPKIDQDSDLIDSRHLSSNPDVSPSSLLQIPADVRQTFIDFAGGQVSETEKAMVYSVNAIPGKSANLNIGRAFVETVW